MREEIQVCFTNYCLQFFFLFLILQLILSMWCQVTKSLFETASNLQYFHLCQGVCVFVHGPFVCQQVLTKTTQQISNELGRRSDLGSAKSPFTSGLDPDKRTDPV